jgi:7,8-dihydropterin-6-yl-methyl-4-(beta-D-ribofuranosyl)aminobenzene 5'-phosphate synthase
MIKTEIVLLANNVIFPFQNLQKDPSLKFAQLNKLFATQSVAEHGLGFMINVYDIKDPNDEWGKKLIKKIIFDTGSSNDTFLYNLNARAYALYDIDMILISHWHYDHTGGLYQILEQVESEIPVICHDSAKFERFFRRSIDVKNGDLEGKKREDIIPLLSTSKIVNQAPIDLNRIHELNAKVKFTKEIHEVFNEGGLKITLSGEIPRIHPEEDFSSFFSLQGGIIKIDKILDDKCLIFEYDDEVVLLLGCCHSGIMNTLDYVKNITAKPISHIIGGFHLANATNQRIKTTIEYLNSFQDYNKPLFLFPIHCSGNKFLFELKRANYSNFKAYNASVGTIFEF